MIEFIQKPSPTLLQIFERERREQEIEELKRIENARADARAVWALADFYLPGDVVETADRLGVKETMSEVWRNAFIAGWRAAHRR